LSSAELDADTGIADGIDDAGTGVAAGAGDAEPGVEIGETAVASWPQKILVDEKSGGLVDLH